jgi:hypothetical protein
LTTPLADGLLTTPYVTVPEFLATPTWLDSQDLIPGGNATQQTNELYNVLLRASAWACRIAEQPLHAHTVIWQDRVPVDRWGDIYITPPHNPVRHVNALAYGSDFQNLSLISGLQAQLWIDGDGRAFQVSQMPNGGSYLGSLQFGGTRPGADILYVQYSYVAGYCATTLTAAASSGASSLTVADPTGLQAPVTGGLIGTVPGSTVRIWDPLNPTASTGGEEAAQVASGWNGANPVTLASSLANAHPIGAGVSELPPEIHTAVSELAIGLLCREDVTDEEPYGGTPFGPTVRQSHSGGKAGGLIDHAREVLLRYRPTVH